MAAFILVLPTDIQVTVLQYWIASPADDKILLKVLSRLDVACCSTVLRLPFLTPVSHRGLHWSTRNGNRTLRVIHNLPCYLAWLVTRKVRLDAPLVQVDENEQLNKLTELAKKGMKLTAIETHCYKREIIVKNVTALSAVFTVCSDTLRSFTFRGNEDFLWHSVEHLTTRLRLKELVMHTYPTFRGYPEAKKSLDSFVCADVLGVLRIDDLKLSNQVVRFICSCKLLNVLEIKALHGTQHQFMSIMQSCSLLRELSLNNPLCCTVHWPTELVEIVQIGQHLKKLKVQQTSAVFQTFAVVLEQCPLLEEVNFHPECIHQRAAKTLHLNPMLEDLTLPVLQRILRACSSLNLLALDADKDHMFTEEAFQLLADCCGSSLQELHIQPFYDYAFEQVAPLIQQCPNLQTLVLADCLASASSVCPLQDIARSCCKLSSIDVSYSCKFTIADADISALLDHCPDLKEILVGEALSVTKVTLQALLGGRRLINFKWTKVGFCTEDLKDFKSQAMELGLLPVPLMEGPLL